MLQMRATQRTLSEGKSQIIGSSSDTYFVNMIRRAFSHINLRTRLPSLLPAPSQPSPEECIVAEDEIHIFASGM